MYYKACSNLLCFNCITFLFTKVFTLHEKEFFKNNFMLNSFSHTYISQK